jgi:hypothetical protein
VIPALAHAVSSLFVIETTGGIRGLHFVQSNIKLTGAISIDFHGDASAGCAAAHVCDVTGTARWNVAGDGSIAAVAFRGHGRRFEQAYLTIGDSSSGEQPLRTSAHVRREGAPGSLCSDAAPGDSTGGSGSPRRGSAVEIRLIDISVGSNDVLRTRCAGPMADDVAALLPARQITERALVRGHRTLDFTADRTFAAHGLAGTLHSSARIQVIDGQRLPFDSGGGSIPNARKRRKRGIDVEYRVERVSGQIATQVRGHSDPDLCAPFDACGIGGSVTTTLAASSGSAYLTASGPVRRTRKELRRAVGLAPGRAPRGLSTYGYASWQRDLGSVVADLTRNGTPTCTDSVPVAGGGFVYLEFPAGRVRASYGAGGLLAGSDTLRTRCPGPGSADVPSALATGSFPLSVFRHKRVTLRLTKGRRFSAVAYSGKSIPEVTVVLRRTRIREYTFTEELPGDYENGHVRPLR